MITWVSPGRGRGFPAILALRLVWGGGGGTRAVVQGCEASKIKWQKCKVPGGCGGAPLQSQASGRLQQEGYEFEHNLGNFENLSQNLITKMVWQGGPV